MCPLSAEVAPDHNPQQPEHFYGLLFEGWLFVPGKHIKMTNSQPGLLKFFKWYFGLSMDIWIFFVFLMVCFAGLKKILF